jgi:photosystem II stability/assembly factor-like uncharacterized protein
MHAPAWRRFRAIFPLFAILLTTPCGRADDVSSAAPVPQSPMSQSPVPQLPVPQMLQALRPRHIGPANMSGRITDVAVYEVEPRIMYVASASGGVWKTVNNGTTWKPVFDGQNTSAIGAVAVDQNNPDVVWVGTGEANPRNSVSWGDGVYLSTDGGRTWKHKGLNDTHHVGRIVLHPTNPDIVYVAALGKLWGPHPERGVFKTADGGRTWQRVLYQGDDTGAVDLAMDSENPDRLYAAMYEVRRDAFSGGNPVTQVGPKAGLYQTADGGKSWTKLTRGLPTGHYGRCGIAIYPRDPRILYAVVQTEKTSVSVTGQGPNERLDPGYGGVFRSDDRGETWRHVNSLAPRPFYYGQVRVDPNNPDRVYVLGIALHVSRNGGRTFTVQNQAKGTHSDYHALWIDPANSHHLVLGCDGGLNFSYDRGATWEYLKNLPVAQFYALGLDNRTPYRVYGGLQDNGSWYGMSATRDRAGITVADWVKVLGYDGYYCQIDPDDPDTVYVEGQYGMLRRINLRTWQTVDIKPRLPSDGMASNIQPTPRRGTADFRFNWSCPILLSPHNPKTVYFAGNVLFRSDNRGDTWNVISPDLTRGKPGPSAHRGHTITTVAESPLKPGLLYVGTDDGNVMVSQDGGRRWYDVTDRFDGMPQGGCVSRVEASRFQEGLVYVSLDRHRSDDRRPYLFKSTDNGTTWTPLANNLPAEGPVYVVREDPRNPDLLYAGTEYGLFISMDGGLSWHKQRHLPAVPVHDLALHPRERDLVIATHGRGIYIMDACPLQELAGSRGVQAAHLCDIRPATAHRRVALTSLGVKSFTGENPAYGAVFMAYVREAPSASPTVTVADAAGKAVKQLTLPPHAGLLSAGWDLNREGTENGDYWPVPSGDYTATLRIGATTLRKQFTIRAE